MREYASNEWAKEPVSVRRLVSQVIGWDRDSEGENGHSLRCLMKTPYFSGLSRRKVCEIAKTPAVLPLMSRRTRAQRMEKTPAADRLQAGEKLPEERCWLGLETVAEAEHGALHGIGFGSPIDLDAVFFVGTVNIGCRRV